MLDRSAAATPSRTRRRRPPGGPRVAVGVASLVLMWQATCCGVASADEAADLEFFEKRIRPVLAQRCWECHGADEAKLRGGLRLDSREAVLQGGETGPAAVPGDPAASLLVEAIGFQSSQIEMPPSGKLPDQEIADLQEWVKRGLPFPSAAATAAAKRTISLEEGRRHWAFAPLRAARTAVSLTREESDSLVERPRSRIDVHLRAEQARRGLKAAPPASRSQLLRRLKFDLLGLPPTPEETAEFVEDESPDAYQRRVDRWLASPHYGERQGRHWLDLVRYCDIPESWREGEAQAYWYRDWVVAAANADLPYSEFIRRQLAADQIPACTPADNAALGFLGLSPSYWKELKLDQSVIKQVVADEWEERIEAIGATFLGLTLACARCHDHKYDPISAEDYYALAGVLSNVRQQDVAVTPAEIAGPAAAARRRVKEIDQELSKLRAVKEPSAEQKQMMESLAAEAVRQRATPGFDIPPAYGVADAALHVLPDGPSRTKLEYRGEMQNVSLQIRGNPAKTGPVVPRRFLRVLASPDRPPFQTGSGRLDLADALVADAAPLVARVAVNRVWMQVFGRGIVTTPSNFGLLTEKPVFHELLDELAADFIAGDWSLKRLRRELVLTAAYRQSSRPTESEQSVDPDNATVWRMPVRRLDVEAWRDAVLFASDELDQRVGGPPLDLNDAQHRRRTLYAVVKRRELSDLLRLYDFPDPVAHSAAREPTTTPLQQLFVLNSPFMAQRSEAFAGFLLRELPSGSDDARIDLAFARLFQRTPSAAQRRHVAAFLGLARQRGEPEPRVWEQVAQVLLGSNELLFVD
ncbi:MAG: PSD1 and planctomycete cytochrome C domain-containing protein [Pirellulales bacterium]